MDPETDFARSVSGSGQKDPDPKDFTNPSHIFAACVSAFCFKISEMTHFTACTSQKQIIASHVSVMHTAQYIPFFL